jgi:hypothetical protein
MGTIVMPLRLRHTRASCSGTIANRDKLKGVHRRSNEPLRHHLSVWRGQEAPP